MSFAPREIQPMAQLPAGSPEERIKQANTIRQLAAFQMAHGALDLAERMTRVALWLDADNVRNWRIRAHCLARMNNPREALKLLSQARTHGVSGIGMRDLLVVGFAFARLGLKDEARKFLTSDKASV